MRLVHSSQRMTVSLAISSGDHSSSRPTSRLDQDFCIVAGRLGSRREAVAICG
jgi:hypothetical protein